MSEEEAGGVLGGLRGEIHTTYTEVQHGAEELQGLAEDLSRIYERMESTEGFERTHGGSQSRVVSGTPAGIIYEEEYKPLLNIFGAKKEELARKQSEGSVLGSRYYHIYQAGTGKTFLPVEVWREMGFADPSSAAFYVVGAAETKRKKSIPADLPFITSGSEVATPVVPPSHIGDPHVTPLEEGLFRYEYLGGGDRPVFTKRPSMEFVWDYPPSLKPDDWGAATGSELALYTHGVPYVPSRAEEIEHRMRVQEESPLDFGAEQYEEFMRTVAPEMGWTPEQMAQMGVTFKEKETVAEEAMYSQSASGSAYVWGKRALEAAKSKDVPWWARGGLKSWGEIQMAGGRMVGSFEEIPTIFGAGDAEHIPSTWDMIFGAPWEQREAQEYPMSTLGGVAAEAAAWAVLAPMVVTPVAKGVSWGARAASRPIVGMGRGWVAGGKATIKTVSHVITPRVRAAWSGISARRPELYARATKIWRGTTAPFRSVGRDVVGAGRFAREQIRGIKMLPGRVRSAAEGKLWMETATAEELEEIQVRTSYRRSLSGGWVAETEMEKPVTRTVDLAVDEARRLQRHLDDMINPEMIAKREAVEWYSTVLGESPSIYQWGYSKTPISGIYATPKRMAFAGISEAPLVKERAAEFTFGAMDDVGRALRVVTGRSDVVGPGYRSGARGGAAAVRYGEKYGMSVEDVFGSRQLIKFPRSRQYQFMQRDITMRTQLPVFEKTGAPWTMLADDYVEAYGRKLWSGYRPIDVKAPAPKIIGVTGGEQTMKLTRMDIGRQIRTSMARGDTAVEQLYMRPRGMFGTTVSRRTMTGFQPESVFDEITGGRFVSLGRDAPVLRDLGVNVRGATGFRGESVIVRRPGGGVSIFTSGRGAHGPEFFMSSVERWNPLRFTGHGMTPARGGGKVSGAVLHEASSARRPTMVTTPRGMSATARGFPKGAEGIKFTRGRTEFEKLAKEVAKREKGGNPLRYLLDSRQAQRGAEVLTERITTRPVLPGSVNITTQATRLGTGMLSGTALTGLTMMRPLQRQRLEQEERGLFDFRYKEEGRERFRFWGRDMYRPWTDTTLKTEERAAVKTALKQKTREVEVVVPKYGFDMPPVTDIPPVEQPPILGPPILPPGTKRKRRKKGPGGLIGWMGEERIWPTAGIFKGEKK